MEPKGSLDPIDVARVLAGIFLSQQVAGIVGPYSIIILAAMAGAAAALANRKPTGRYGSFAYFFGATLASVLLTVPAASLVATLNDKWEAQVFFVPVAALLSYTVDRWKELVGSGVDAVKRLIRNWATKGAP